jgi:hypothetical protein
MLEGNSCHWGGRRQAREAGRGEEGHNEVLNSIVRRGLGKGVRFELGLHKAENILNSICVCVCVCVFCENTTEG